MHNISHPMSIANELNNIDRFHSLFSELATHLRW